MDIIKDARAKISALKKNVEKIAFASIKKNKKFIIEELLQAEQLSKGFASSEERLSFNNRGVMTSGFYTSKTQKHAKDTVKPKIAGESYNFQWTGETFALMDIKKVKLGYEIFTKDDKDLEEFYGKIYDLNARNEILVEEVIVEVELEREFSKLLDNLFK